MPIRTAVPHQSGHLHIYLKQGGGEIDDLALIAGSLSFKTVLARSGQGIQHSDLHVQQDADKGSG